MNQKFGLKGYILNDKFYLEIIELPEPDPYLDNAFISAFTPCFSQCIIASRARFPLSFFHHEKITFVLPLPHSCIDVFFGLLSSTTTELFSVLSLFLSHSPCISMKYLLRHKIYTCILWRDIVCMCVCAHTIALLLYICFGSFLLILSDVVSSSEKSQ